MTDYKTYDDAPGLGADFPSLESLEFVQGDKSVIAGPDVKVIVVHCKYDKGGCVLWNQFTKATNTFPQVKFIGIFTDPEKDHVNRFFEKREFQLTFPAAWDKDQIVRKNIQTVLKVGALPIPYGFIVKDGKIVWQQLFSQNHQLHNSNFLGQLRRVVSGEPVELNGPTPVPEESSSESEEKPPEGDGDLSLF